MSKGQPDFDAPLLQHINDTTTILQDAAGYISQELATRILPTLSDEISESRNSMEPVAINSYLRELPAAIKLINALNSFHLSAEPTHEDDRNYEIADGILTILELSKDRSLQFLLEYGANRKASTGEVDDVSVGHMIAQHKDELLRIARKHISAMPRSDETGNKARLDERLTSYLSSDLRQVFSR